MERLGGQVEVDALAAVGVGEREGPDRRPDQLPSNFSRSLLLALADVAHPAVEVDQRADLVVADGGGRDHVAAVGVADEHDRTVEGPQELGQVCGVAGEVAKRVAEPDRGVAAVVQGADLGVEARRVGPSAVDQDDRRGPAVILVTASILTVCRMPRLGPGRGAGPLTGMPRHDVIDHRAAVPRRPHTWSGNSSSVPNLLSKPAADPPSECRGGGGTRGVRQPGDRVRGRTLVSRR